MPATFSISRANDLERVMTAVMIGVDPHKGSHTAVVIGGAPTMEPFRALAGPSASALLPGTVPMRVDHGRVQL
jgi:hypothetical protein